VRQAVKQERAVLTYKEAVELAKRCALNARLALTKEAAAELWTMTREYQEEAAKLDSGRKPDIGELPPWLKE
jgi:hypothetical protein